MEYSVKNKEQHKIIELKGNLDIYSASKMKKEVIQIIDTEGVTSLILDMAHVSHMDSSGIALLANLQKKLKTEESKFALVNVTGDIMAVLKLSSLDSFFTIYPTENDIK